jgi:glycolate oxidase
MLKRREAAHILENIVGCDNFSEDPAIIASYTFHMSLVQDDKDWFDTVKMGAVILPGSVEEVQAITKVCNRYKINFKALSTGVGGPHPCPSKEGSLQLDMRRMNRILKIDADNGYAVIEPYVSAIEFVKELWKVGLTFHIIGAGAQHSVLASVTNMEGVGSSSLTASTNDRNSLGEEWVTPTGEVVRWGLVDESKAGHPGPGLHGITRGASGPSGCLGVWTKVAVKLYPWPGPASFEITGKHPTRGYKIPPNFKVYHLALATPQKMADIVYKIAEAKVAYHVWSYPIIYHVSKWMVDTNDEHVELWKKMEAAGILPQSTNPLSVVLAAFSRKELDFKVKVLEDIIAEEGAKKLLADFMTEHDNERFLAAHLTQSKQCNRMRLGMGGANTLIQVGAFDGEMKIKDPYEAMIKKYTQRGVLTDSGGSSFWGGPHEQSGWGHSEYVTFSHLGEVRLASPGVIEGQTESCNEITEHLIKEKLLFAGINPARPTDDVKLSQYLDNYYEYKRKIKKAMDPNGVADPSFYPAD